MIIEKCSLCGRNSNEISIIQGIRNGKKILFCPGCLNIVSEQDWERNYNEIIDGRMEKSPHLKMSLERQRKMMDAYVNMGKKLAEDEKKLRKLSEKRGKS